MLANCLFSRDPERPFDTERPRNWGSFGAELNGLKPWRRGGFRCFLGGWLVVENASNFGRQSSIVWWKGWLLLGCWKAFGRGRLVSGGKC